MVAKQVLVPLVLAALSGTSTATPVQQSLEQLPSGLREAVLDATYAVTPTKDKEWTAPNSAQRMHSTFTAEEGVRIEGCAGGGTWGLSLELEAWGRSGALIPVQAVEPVAVGRRVEYRRGPLTEWYVNDARGLEQGFTIDEQPSGEGAIEIALAVGQGLAAEVRPGGRDALFTDRSTGSVLHYSGLRAWDAAQRELEASLAVSGNRLWIRVEDEHAMYPIQIDPWIATEEAILTASDPEDFAMFGGAVAVSGDTAIVGASQYSSAGETWVGAAYVFVRTGTSWTEQQKLMASDGTSFDRFGQAVALCGGDLAIVGAPGYTHPNGSSGLAYLFIRQGTSWSEQQKIVAATPFVSEFGDSLACSNDTLVVGDPHGGVDDTGAAFVFVWNGSAFTQQASLTSNALETADYFGDSVAISGGTIVVGASSDNFADFSEAGSAYVFVADGTSWSEQQRLVASDPHDESYFGSSVAIWADTIAVGAPRDEVAGVDDAGSVNIFVRSGEAWTEQQALDPRDPDSFAQFGNSVALLDDTLLVGNPGDGKAAQGAISLFGRSGATWSLLMEVTASNPAPGAGFGRAGAFSGDVAVVGAPQGSFSTPGSAYVFRLSPEPESYCTAGTSAAGCQALLSATGSASATAPSGFTLQAGTVEGQKDGLFFFGTNGQQANSWGNGTSYQCVVPPVVRTQLLTGTGTNGLCDGAVSLDMNAVWTNQPNKNPGAGATVQAQLWYRDPLSTSNQTTSLSDAIEFVVGL